MSVTRDERRAMCDLLDELGPDQPTLCGTWTTRDLLAHLLVRERRLDASAGIVVPALSGYTERIRLAEADQPFADMVRTFRQGPPLWAVPWSVPLVGDRANLFEFYVHHEDIRRAQPGWVPRPEDHRRDEALWGSLKLMGRVLFRHSPVGVTLRTVDHKDEVAKRGPNGVILVGLPSEITLLAFGRAPELARVVIQGEPADVDAFVSSDRGI